MASVTLGSALKQLGLSDAAFAEKCGQHRTEIWAYRTKRRMPRADTAAAIASALRKMGMQFTDLLWR